MSGSYGHIRGNNGEFDMGSIEHMGEAREALEECFDMIEYLSGGKAEKRVAARHYYLRTRLPHHQKQCDFCRDLYAAKHPEGDD